MAYTHEHNVLVDLMKGDLAAVHFIETLFQISQIWDAVYDGDADASKESLHKAFWLSLVVLPSNPFYRENQAVLQPLMQSFIIDWLDANELEKADDHGRNIAFVLRDSIGAIISHCALIVGGFDWMRQVSAKARRLLIFDETLEEYKAGLGE